MSHWAPNSVFYHLYPLGLLGAPERNDGVSAPRPRLEGLHPWIEHARDLGANALYLGPVFESSAHGYDTADYFTVDRRLGTAATLAGCVERAHALGMRVVLDGVFHHVGRDFWAFRDVQARGAESPYASWFAGLRFDRRSPLGDPFAYETWDGHWELVRLEVRNPAVREHLLAAVSAWVEGLGIDGLRLDAADKLDLDFQKLLGEHCRRLRPDFWLMGEVVHGDYRRWASPERLDSVTNYEGYKSLWSSHADRNYFELAYALNRQSGPDGIYRHLTLYNFADNHDVDRVASSLRTPRHLRPLYALLFAMPGAPSIYYGSEFALEGRRSDRSDRALRPALDLGRLRAEAPTELLGTIRRLAGLRRESRALSAGDYRPLKVASEQLAFARTLGDETVVVAANSGEAPAALELTLPASGDGRLVDRLGGDFEAAVRGGHAKIEVPPYNARILWLERAR